MHMMMARWWWLAPVALAAASASEVCDADVVAAASCPRGAELLRRAKARRLPLAVTMLWATCPERPPADDDDELAKYKESDPARYAKLKRRRDREPDLGRKRPDPGWCLRGGGDGRRRLLNGGFAQLRDDEPRLVAALGQACLLRRATNGTVPLVVLARNVAPAASARLCEAGVVVVDAARLFGSNPFDAWRPVTAAAAKAEKRTVSGYVQDRKDGAMTYHKFAVWRLGCFFDAVLQIDLDATVLEDPRPFAASHAQITATGAVVAEEENAKRDFVGMRTHLVLLKPDERIFDALLAKARTGDYVAMTNTDQDVLEAYFCPGPRQWVGEPKPPNRPPDDKQPADGVCDVDRGGARGFANVHPAPGRLYRENALVYDLRHMHLRGGYRHPHVVQDRCAALGGPAAAAHCRACFPAEAPPKRPRGLHQGRDGSLLRRD